jgi:AcrR family transcriptional regulator
MVWDMTKRLSKSDWLECGLKTLVRAGSNALKAEPISKSLDVSRGSFYWHFKDIDAFRTGVLDLWRDRTTRQTMDAIEKEAATSDKMVSLLYRAFTSDPALERAVRAWAQHDENVSDTVARVDDERIRYIEKLLIESGLSHDDALKRSVFLYWAFLGQLMVAKSRAFTVNMIDLEKIEELITRPN